MRTVPIYKYDPATPPFLTVTAPTQDNVLKNQTVGTELSEPCDSSSTTDLSQMNINDQPREVAIYYAKGTKVIMIDRKLICDKSAFFNQACGGTSEESSNDNIRLRSDFPFGVEAMIMFLKEGYYDFNVSALNTYPRLTILDMHVHAYILAVKYSIPTLACHAIAAYIGIAKRLLADYVNYVRAYPTVSPDQAFNYHFRLRLLNADSPIGQVEHVLNSMSLLWRNTTNNDVMRFGVLVTIEPFFNRLARLELFSMMCTDLHGFAEDLELFFDSQGLDFAVIRTPLGGKRYVRFFSTGGFSADGL